MLKRHLRQQRTVEEYGRNIKQLAGRAQGLLSAGHPEGCVCLLGQLGQIPGVRPGASPTRIPSGPRRKTGTVFPKTVGLRKLPSGLLIGPIPFYVVVLCNFTQG